MSPYFGKTFFPFIHLYFSRLIQLLSGQLAWSELASDEIQIGVLALLSVAAALVGSFLVLKKMTMLANSLSHTILLGIVISYLCFSSVGGGFKMELKVLIGAALITGFLTTLLTQVVHQVLKLQEDASIGLVFTTLFALGILLVTLYTRNAHIGLEAVMGNVDALHRDDLQLSLLTFLIDAFFIFSFFKEWKLVCFDPMLASSLGISPSPFHYLLMLLTAATAISAFRAVGVLLFLAFLVGLPLIARLWTSHLSRLLFYGGVCGIFLSIIGVALSRHVLTVYRLPISTAGLIVALIGSTFIATLFAQKMYSAISLSRLNRFVLDLTFRKKWR